MNQRDIPTLPDAEADASDLPTRLGHFEVVGRLGAGGMGLVFEGRDSGLDRRVALKLLHPNRTGSPVAPARLLREAQALAKLSHPNVVTVFEVGMAGNDPYVAMELVEGKTMLEWMRDPRAWRDVLDVFIAVGQGLAAVHALGLVHRDFKPSNVLFDARGVPKLGDFGLVRTVDGAEPVSVKTPSSETAALTETGSMMGTPAYMAPEQHLGLTVDTRADQYSFAKTLREALPERAPAALEPILARALSDDAADRYPAMDPLLAALARVRRGNRARWIASGVGVAVVAAVALAWGVGRAHSVDEPCPRPTDRLATVWSGARRSTLEAHLQTIDPAQGKQRFAAAAPVFDRGGEKWLDLHVEACQFSHEGRQSDALLDRRMSCLDRALVEIDDTVGLLERSTNRTTLDDSMRAVVGLPTLDDCADVAALTELVMHPTNPLQRAEGDALARDAIAIDLALRSGTKNTNLADRARTAVTRARALGDPETLARALRSLAGIQLELESGGGTLATLREAITAASAAHDDRLVSELWATMLSTLVVQKQPTDAKTLVPAAEAAVARSKSTVELHVNFLQAKSMVASSNKDVPHAQELLAEATKALEEGGANAPNSPLRPLVVAVRTRTAVTYAVGGDWKHMTESLRAVIPVANAVYGADHPSLMQLHFNLGVGLRHVGDEAAALVEFREAARIGEARLAPSPSLAGYIHSVGSTLVAMNHADEALGYLERAVAMTRSTLPASDPRLAEMLGTLGAAYHDKGRYDEAKQLLDEEISILDRREIPDDNILAVALFNRGEWGVQTHHCDQVRTDLARSLAIYELLQQPDDIYGTLQSIGQCQLDLRQWLAARRTTERILAAPGVSPQHHALAKFAHGVGLTESGQRSAGIAEVRTSRDELQKLEMTDVIILVDRWLAKQNAK